MTDPRDERLHSLELEIAALRAKGDRAERRFRATIAFGVAAFLAGAVLLPTRTVVADDKPKVVEATAFHLLDAGGKVRANLTTVKDEKRDLVMLSFQGPGGADDKSGSLTLALGTDGQKALVFALPDKKSQLQLTSDEKGARIYVHDKDGNSRLYLGANSSGEVIFNVEDTKKTPRIQMKVAATGTPDILLVDANSKMRARLTLGDADGAPIFRLIDAKGESLFQKP